MKSMKKFIDLAVEVIDSLKKDKYVEGSLHKDKQTGKIVFRAYVRQSRNRHERLICQIGRASCRERVYACV